MKKSDLIKLLEKSIKANGDGYLQAYMLSDIDVKTEFFMTSKTRKNKNGDSAKMTYKEFKKFVEENK